MKAQNDTIKGFLKIGIPNVLKYEIIVTNLIPKLTN